LTTLDRYILRSLLINYLIALAVMISLYIVLDMFVNMDEFTEHGYPLWTVVGNMIDFYAPNVFKYFAQLSGVITSFACFAVLSRMRKLNEMTAVLASGVSLYRVALPIAAFGAATTALLIFDTEVLIPSVANKLARDHDDADNVRPYEVVFLREADGSLLSAQQFHPVVRDLRNMLVILRDEDGRVTSTIEADHAVWEPPGPTHERGRWVMERARQTTRVSRPATGLAPREDLRVTYPRYYESDLSPEAIETRQAEGWIRFLSLAQLRQLQRSDSPNRADIIRTRYARVSDWIVALILLLLGLPFFLDRSRGNVLADAAKCMTVCGLCYVVTFVAQSIRPETVSPLPAWIPIFVFGTLAIVLLDRVKT